MWHGERAGLNFKCMRLQQQGSSDSCRRHIPWCVVLQGAVVAACMSPACMIDLLTLLSFCPLGKPAHCPALWLSKQFCLLLIFLLTFNSICVFVATGVPPRRHCADRQVSAECKSVVALKK
jgi:hypothetical protein